MHAELGSLEELTSTFTRQGYLDKVKVQLTDKPTYEWHWGGRAKVEFRTEDVIHFMRSMYDQEDDDSARLTIEIRRAAGIDAIARS